MATPSKSRKKPRRSSERAQTATPSTSSDVPASTDHPIPKDLRSSEEVARELRRRTAAASQVVLAALEAVDATDGADEKSLRLGECAVVAARGANELRDLFFRITDDWGEHPDLDEVIWAGGLLAACQACALFAEMQGEMIDEGCAVWVEGGGHLVGLEWCAKVAARAYGHIGAQRDLEEAWKKKRTEEPRDEREFAVLALREIAIMLGDLGIDDIGDDEVKWVHQLADRVAVARWCDPSES